MSKGSMQKIRTFKADLEAARSNSAPKDTPETKIAPPKDTSTAINTVTKSSVPPAPLDLEDVEQPKEEKEVSIKSQQEIKPTPLPKVSTPAEQKEINLTAEIPAPKKEVEPEVEITPIETKDIRQEVAKETPAFLSVENQEADTDAEAESDFTNGIGEGTIVSNKRVGHYSLWRAFKDNVSSLQKGHQRKIAAKKEAEPKVSKAESRIDTLKKAAKASYRAPQSDHGILLKQVKKRELEEVPESNIVVKEKDEVPKPHWQHVVGQHEESEPEKVPEKITEETTPEIETETTTPKTTEVTGKTKKEEIEETAPKKQTTSRKETPTPKKEASPKKTKKEATPEPSTDSSEQKTTTKPKKEAANILKPVLIGALVLLLVVSTGGGVWYFLQQRQSTETTRTETPKQQLVNGDTDHLINIDSDVDTIFSTIYNHMVESRNFTTHTFITDTNTLADPNNVITALNFRLTGSFARALTNITVGSVDGTEPFIVMRATNFDTAFAGMLAWEKSLSIDVSPLFGEPVTESFDPDARTDTQIRSAFYKDDVVANTSVRILRDDTNNSRITYGFADPNTIVITTNESTYEQLLERLRQQR